MSIIELIDSITGSSQIIDNSVFTNQMAYAHQDQFILGSLKIGSIFDNHSRFLSLQSIERH